MKHFFYIDRVQQWINIFKIITIYRSGAGWVVTMEGNINVSLYDNEYEELGKMLEEFKQTAE